jgi:transposase
LDSELACRFLLRWSSLEQLQQEDPSTIAAFYRQQHCCRPQLLQQRLARIAAAVPLTTDPAVVDSGRLLIQALAAQLLALQESLKEYDRSLAALMQQHPDAAIFHSFPGAGEALAPRLVAAFGTDRARLQDAAQMQALSGIAPVTQQSGKQRRVTRRWACNKFLRQTFHEFAQHSLGRSRWAKAYYDQMRRRGVKHHAAVRALAFKWIRVLYRCWKDRTLYNEAHYLAALARKHPSLLTSLPATS